MPRDITLKDVAAHAGVSRTTASNVITGSGRVSTETRERVHRSMRELGYVYNRGAASLRTLRTSTVGVVVTNIASPFFGELLVGLEAALTDAGFLSLVVATADDAGRQEALVAELREQRVAGLAIVPATGTSPAFLDGIREARIPHVLMTRFVEGADAPYVGPDDVAGGRLAAGHLLEHGARTFAYVGGPAQMRSRAQRIEGMRSALTEHGVPPSSVVDLPSPSTGQGGLWAGERLLERGGLPEAIVCHSDSVAFGLYRALRMRRRAGDVRVIGYDDVSTAALWEPPLTSVATHPELLGRAAAQQLVEQLVEGGGPSFTDDRLAALALPGEDERHRLYRPELRIRRSCGCPDLP